MHFNVEGGYHQRTACVLLLSNAYLVFNACFWHKFCSMDHPLGCVAVYVLCSCFLTFKLTALAVELTVVDRGPFRDGSTCTGWKWQ